MWKLYGKAPNSPSSNIDGDNSGDVFDEESILDSNILAMEEENSAQKEHFKVVGNGISSCILSTIKFLSPTFSKNEIINFITKKDNIQPCLKETYVGLKAAAKENKFLKIDEEQGTLWPNSTNRSKLGLMVQDILEFIDIINQKKNNQEYFYSLLTLQSDVMFNEHRILNL